MPRGETPSWSPLGDRVRRSTQEPPARRLVQRRFTWRISTGPGMRSGHEGTTGYACGAVLRG